MSSPPGDDIIDLPVGSTPIDFAYHVHTEIGHRCRGAKVNGKLVTLDYVLKTGDVVEILTAKHGGPSRDWLNANLKLVNTQRARSKIRNWFKQQDREQNLDPGQSTARPRAQTAGVEIPNLKHWLRHSNTAARKICMWRLDAETSRSAGLLTKSVEITKEKQDPLLVPTAVGERSQNDTSMTVLGLKGMLTTFARCCKPVPGDDIVGYITRGRGVTIHRHDCPNILRLHDRERIIKVSWGAAPKTYPVPVEIRAYDRQGSDGGYFECPQRRKH